MPHQQVGASEVANLPTIDADVPRPPNMTDPAEARDQMVAGLKTVKKKHLLQVNPRYDLETWSDYDALYSGGKKIKERVEKGRLLYKRAYELDAYWTERKERLHYFNYFGSIVDYYGAYTFVLQPEFRLEDAETMPEFYEDEFLKDSDRQGTDFADFLKAQLTTALVQGRAYTLIDKPMPIFGPGVPASLAEQEAAGDLRSYLVKIDPRQIIDWEEDDTGNLQWVLRYSLSSRRESPQQSRGDITHTWTWYDRMGFMRWSLAVPRDKKLADLPDDHPIPMIAEGPHATPGMLPVVRMNIPEGLWVGAKAGDIQIAHLNKRSAADWSHYTSLFRMPWLKTDGPTTKDDGEDVHGVTWGPGYYLSLGPNDEVGFLEPSGAIDAVAAADTLVIKDEMYRVNHQMALSVTDASQTSAPAEGKRRDSHSTTIVLKALGKAVREYSDKLLHSVGVSRAEEHGWATQGMDKFDIDSLPQMLEDTITVQAISIPSPTFQKELKKRIALRVLDGIEPAMQKTIVDEIEKGVDEQDQMNGEMQKAQRDGLKKALKDGAVGDDDDDNNDKGDDDGAGNSDA